MDLVDDQEESEIDPMTVAEVSIRSRGKLIGRFRRLASGPHLLAQRGFLISDHVGTRGDQVRRDEESCAEKDVIQHAGPTHPKGDRGALDQGLEAIAGHWPFVGALHSRPTLNADFPLALPTM